MQSTQTSPKRDLKGVTGREFDSTQLSYEERIAFRYAIHVGYLRTAKTNKYLVSCWRAQCEHTKQPFVHLSLDTKSPRLEIDLSKTEASFTVQTVIILKFLCLFTGLMWRVSTPKSFLVTQLPIEQAEPFAQIVMQLLRHFPKATHTNTE